MPTGRSPYPLRSQRRQQQQQGGQGGNNANLSSMALDSSVLAAAAADDYSTHRSPRHSTGSTNSSYRLGRSLVQARLSPRPPVSTTANTTAHTPAAPPTAQSSLYPHQTPATAQPVQPTSTVQPPLPTTVKTQRFFGSPMPPTNSPQKQTQQAHTALPLPDGSDEVVDGVNLSQLRRLANACLGQAQDSSIITANSPAMAVFYASIVYSKSMQSPMATADAVLYAKTLLLNAEPKRAVRLLEQAGLFSAQGSTSNRNTNHQGWNSITPMAAGAPAVPTPRISGSSMSPLHLRLEATLIATQALAVLEEWQSVLTLLEDAHLYSSIQRLAVSANRDASHILPPNQNLLDDDDDSAWQELAASLEDVAKQTYIHPLARICCWRGRAYAETGHPLRASIYFKRAIKLDGLCVEALEGLLDKSVLPPHQTAVDTILELQLPPDMEWLRALYLARVHVVAPTTHTKAMAANPTSQDPAQQDVDIPQKGAAASHFQFPASTTNKSTLEDPFWQDASSIQLLTPITAKAPSDEADVNMSTSFFGTKSGMTGNAASSKENQKKQMQVEGALDSLMDTYKLSQSSEVLAMAAERAYRQSDLPLALKYCQELARVDPLCTTAGYVHVSTLVALGHKRTLFRLAHEWVDAAPKSARAWYAVGSYYFACGRYHVAQRHFCRATRLNSDVVECWIAFGVSFAACDESDQALASFRAAQRLAPGDPTSLLYIGMEYLRTNHKTLAEHFLKVAHQTSHGTDRLCMNELGVWHLNDRKYEVASIWFLRALGGIGTDEELAQMVSLSTPKTDEFGSSDVLTRVLSQLLDSVTDSYWEATIFNLASALRKNRKFDHAVACLERCLALKPQNNASALSALGFCLHLRGDLDAAIDTYHRALAVKPGDPFCGEMLQSALRDALERTTEMFDSIGIASGEETGGFKTGIDIAAHSDYHAGVTLGTGSSLFQDSGDLGSETPTRRTGKRTNRPSNVTMGSAIELDASYLSGEEGLSMSADLSSDVDMG